MAKVTEITVPLPSDLTPCDCGVESRGQAYTLTMPGVTTEPMRVTSGGYTFTATPAELLYTGLDASGNRQWDYIVGSIPTSVATRGREARYTRSYQSADDVFIAQEEKVKHFTVLHEPLRVHAEYLTSDVEIGISSMIGGIPLPSGYHDAIEVFGFVFPRPFARDLEGREFYGRYEVVNSDVGQMLYVWFPAEWMMNATYPVMIDPTVVVTGTSGGCTGEAQLSDGTLVLTILVAGGTAVYVSRDAGQSWNQVTSPTGGIVTTKKPSVLRMIPDADDRMHVLIGGVTTADNLSYQQWQFSSDRMTITVTETQVEAAPGGSIYRWIVGDITVWGAAGASKNLAMCYLKVNYNDGTSTMYLYARTASVTIAGVLTLDTRYTKDSVSRGGDEYHPALSRKNDNSVKLMWAMDNTNTGGPFIKVATISGGATTIGVPSYFNEICGVDGMSGYRWIGQLSAIYVMDDTGVKKSTAANWGAGNVSATGDATGGKIMVFSARGSALTNPNYPGMFEYNEAANTITDKGALNTTVAASSLQIQAPRNNFDGAKAHMAYRKSGAVNDVYSEVFTYNSAPSQPTISLSLTTFAASAGTDITVTHNDTDQMSAYALKRNDNKWWNNSTKAFDQTSEYWNSGSGFSVTIPAADNANDWTADNVYQLYAATKDSYGVAGPYTSTGVVANVGEVPSVTISSTTSTTTVNYVVQWTVDRPQGAYRVRVLNGATEVSTTGKVTDVSARARTIELPTNAVTYTVEVTCWDQTFGGGVASTPATKSATTSFTPVANPTLSVSPLSDGGYIGTTWESPTPTGGQPTCAYVDLYRQEGSGSFLRVAAQLPASGSYPDHNTASGVNYTYFVRAVGENATIADSETGSSSITFNKGDLWLHALQDPQATVHLFTLREQAKDERTHASADFNFVGRKLPVTRFDANMDTRQITVRIGIPDDSPDRNALEVLYEMRSTLCLRDGRGRKVFCVLKSLPVSDEKWGGYVDATFNAVAVKEEM